MLPTAAFRVFLWSGWFVALLDGRGRSRSADALLLLGVTPLAVCFVTIGALGVIFLPLVVKPLFLLMMAPALPLVRHAQARWRHRRACALARARRRARPQGGQTP